jgi:ankyrin repeat protein
MLFYVTRSFLLILLIFPALTVAAQQKDLEFSRALYGALNTGDAQKLASLIDRVDPKELDDLLLYSLGQNPKTPVEVVRLLVDKGADVNPETRSKTPLMHAASQGNDEVIKLLLARGAQVNVLTDDGTPLMMAVIGGHTEALKLLLAAGADVKTVHRTGDNALIMAARQRSYRNPTLEPNSENVRLLLAHGADPNAKGDWGRTALMHANTAAKVKFLVAGGANVEARDEYGQTALMKAASDGYAAVVSALIESRVNVNAFDNKSMTALLFSLDEENYVMGDERETLPARRLEVARRLLLAKSINVNAQNVNGETALIRAVRLGNVEIVKSLLDHGADPRRSDVFGNTPAILAYEKDNAEMAALLPPKFRRQSQNVLNAFLRAAVGKKDEAKVKELLAAGADPNHEFAIDYAHKSIKRTVLILAARMGHLGIVELLLKKGANVNAKGLIFGSEHGLEYGTALDAAVSWKHPEVAALLRKAAQD